LKELAELHSRLETLARDCIFTDPRLRSCQLVRGRRNSPAAFSRRKASVIPRQRGMVQIRSLG